MRELLRFVPIYQTRVWGGRALETALGRALPPGDPIGESWEIVDRPEAQSVVGEGPQAGQSLRSVLELHSAEVMGPGWPAGRPFPILIKWLDCRERLSLQVHPPAEVAGELRGEPKTENWYIAATSPGARLIVGLRRGVTRERFTAAVAAGSLEDCVHAFSVAAGDSILVHSGQVTYRVYDWGRVGLDGRPREMHLAQSLHSIDWDDFEPAPLRAAPTSGVIAECREFRIRRVLLDPGQRFHLRAGEGPRLVSVVSGALSAGAEPATARPPVRLARGDPVLAPHAGAFTFSADSAAIALVTEAFTA
jgi:mannose-6-phosphate isomerase